ncbi:diphosphomevalonate decarboxylase [Brevibacterium sp. BRM-1]|uniref:diphosphomevalonate decarboxylase n=1 Tax=Brevibacterium sp. BRM-1 TaxID=2999062 RepID=UPI00227FE663|nr:diphosphomevalonate decarboxylase [Brevibacterium sp. BRM-1]WAL39417.1 diphosphomevalonate decarboxylase [Brevibacterium sp. BRM-1]
MSAPGTATARAQPNIALVKYWGKRDEDLILPVAGSLSMTLDAFPTTTRVSVDPALDEDSFELNGAPAPAAARARTVRFLERVRELAGASARARVVSANEAPTGAGLASSAAGFAALALAASRAYGLDLDAPALSRLARRGSGSACRSIVDRYALWHAGTDDASSFAEAVPAPDMRLVIVTVDGSEKDVSSREGMRRTAATSPFYPAWAATTEQTLEEMVTACAAGDFEAIGQLTESHALRMHAVINASMPPVRYLAPASVAVFDAAASLRAAGVSAWATADAGPNVCVLTRPDDAAEVAAAVAPLGAVRTVGPGSGARLVDSAQPEAGQ